MMNKRDLIGAFRELGIPLDDGGTTTREASIVVGGQYYDGTFKVEETIVTVYNDAQKPIAVVSIEHVAAVEFSPNDPENPNIKSPSK